MLTLAEKRKPEMWDPGTHGGWAGALQVLSTGIILIAVCECKSPAPVCQAMGTKGKNKLHWSSWCQCVPQIIHSNIFSSKRGDKENQNFCVVEKSLCTIQMSNGTGCCVLVLLKPPSCPHWATLLHFGSFNNSFFISRIRWLMVFVQENLLFGLQNNFTVLCSSTLRVSHCT